jgi:glycosyltransferase involved in cell wall biosynthesis
MRVLHVNDTGAHVGGAETNLFSIMRLFQGKGHDQFLCAFGGGGKSNEKIFVLDDAARKRRPKFFGLVEPSLYFNRRVYDALIGHIKKINPDVVHLHNNFLYTNSVLKSLKDSGKPVVQSAHDYGIICPTAWCIRKDGSLCEGDFGWKCLKAGCLWTKKFIREYVPRKRAGKLMKDVVGEFICPSRRIQEMLESNGIANTVHVPYFVFPERFDPNPKKRVEAFILYVGVLFPHKGVNYLIDAMPAILKENKKAVLHIVGDGPEKEKLRKQVQRKKLEDNVMFHGKLSQEQVPGIYSKANVVVVPSVWMEQFGIVGLEAMASGRPIVGSNVGGIPDWLSDGKTGFLTKPRNSEDLAEKIKLILNNKELAIKMGSEGRKICEKTFSAEAVYPKLLEVYESVAR